MNAVPDPAPGHSRTERRAVIGDRFLDALEDIVRRHRSPGDGQHADLQAELIAAEVAHHLALVRAQLARAPHLAAARGD
jgi:hypothetical protein